MSLSIEKKNILITFGLALQFDGVYNI